jgi:Ca2+-binding EF-hand superfamily protein
MTDLLDKKLRHFFTLMDHNDSGFLEHHDYVIAADRVSAAFGFAPDSAENNGLRHHFTRFWEDVVKPMDTSADQKVSFEEYLAAYNEGVRDAANGYDRISPITDAIIGMADSEGTGKITIAGFTSAMAGGYGIDAHACHTMFTTLDTKNLGYLTRGQLQEASKEYFLSTDPDAPGNGLFGTF